MIRVIGYDTGKVYAIQKDGTKREVNNKYKPKYAKNAKWNDKFTPFQFYKKEK